MVSFMGKTCIGKQIFSNITSTNYESNDKKNSSERIISAIVQWYILKEKKI